jgi:hypothetical protein
MTPLKEPWVADEIANNPSPSYYSLVMSSYENPHVTKEALDQFFGTLTPDELETRRDGKFLHLQGLVFKEFKKEIHVIPPLVPDNLHTVYVAIDTHPRTPHALSFMAVDRRTNMFVVHEIFKNGTPDEVANWVIDYHKRVHPVELALIDPSSQGDQNRGDSTADVIMRHLSAHGIPLDFGSKDLSGGILLVQEAFMSRNRIPSLFICENCTRTIWELGRYTWSEWAPGTGSTKGEKNKPVDRDDHLVEDIRRLVQLPVRYVPPRHAATFNDRYQPLDPEAGY